MSEDDDLTELDGPPDEERASDLFTSTEQDAFEAWLLSGWAPAFVIELSPQKLLHVAAEFFASRPESELWSLRSRIRAASDLLHHGGPEAARSAAKSFGFSGEAHMLFLFADIADLNKHNSFAPSPN